MKKYILISAMMVVSTIIFAQVKTDPSERAARQADRMKKELALTDAQYNTIKANNESVRNKFSALRSDSTLSKEARREKMKALHQEKEAVTKKTLTTEQNAKRESIAKARTDAHKGRGKRSADGHALHMKKNLSLSDDQTAKIKAIDKEFGPKFRAIKRDSTLAKEDARKQAKQLHEEYRSKTKAVLNDEQLKKWEAEKIERRKKKKQG